MRTEDDIRRLIKHAAWVLALSDVRVFFDEDVPGSVEVWWTGHDGNNWHIVYQRVMFSECNPEEELLKVVADHLDVNPFMRDVKEVLAHASA